MKKKLFEWFYRISIGCLILYVRIGAVFNTKLSQKKSGHSLPFPIIQENNEKIWFHVSSLGEYEQAKPLMDEFRDNYAIILTFFSPSGIHYVSSDVADYILYLPYDTVHNARTFIEYFQPRTLILTKYDVWYHFISEMYRRHLPVFIISAYYETTPWFLKHSLSFLEMKSKISWIFLQDIQSKQHLTKIGYHRFSITGDTRIDRVLNVGKKNTLIEKIAPLFRHKKEIIVWGSTWPQDEVIFKKFLSQKNQGVGHIIAPHDIHPSRIEELERISSTVGATFANITNVEIISDHMPIDVLIVNKIGALKYLYALGNIAHIGGGWNKGVHNTLEAVVHQLPFTCGPKYQRSKEIVELIHLGVGKSIQNVQEFKAFYNAYPEKLEGMRGNIRSYFEVHKNSTGKVFSKLKELLDGESNN